MEKRQTVATGTKFVVQTPVMSHNSAARLVSSRGRSCQPRGRHRCLVDDVLRGLWRQAGGEGRSRPLSEALERALRRQLGADWVRIRAQFGKPVLAGGPPTLEDGVVRVPVPVRGDGLGWVLELGLTPGQVLTDAHWQAIRRAIGVWELAAEFDRKGGSLPRQLMAHQRVRDGAAPLIGISQAMCRLREPIPIERLQLQETPVLYHDLFTNGIVYLDLAFDLHVLPKDLLSLTEVFARALLEMGTDKEDYVKLSQRIGKYTGGIRGSAVTATTLGMRQSVAKLMLRGKATGPIR